MTNPGAFTKFCNQDLPEELTLDVRGCALPVFGVILSPVVEENLLKDSRDGRQAFVAKLQAHELIGEGVKAGPLIKELKDLVVKARGASNLAKLLGMCENYDWVTGVSSIQPGKPHDRHVFFLRRRPSPWHSKNRQDEQQQR